MAKFKQEYELENGWSNWIYPIHGIGKRNYKLVCCDCDLVHNVQFRVVKNIQSRAGRFSVMFRVSRNKRSTALARRAKRARR